MFQFFWLWLCEYFFDFHQTTKRFEVQCLGYKLAYLWLVVSPVGVTTYWCEITLPILLVFGTKMHLYVCQFEGNVITCLHFMAVFWQVCEKKKNTKKWVTFWRQIWHGTIYFRSGMCSLLICQHLHSELGLVQTRYHKAMNTQKIVLCFFWVNILTLCTHTLPHNTHYCVPFC